MRHSRIEGVPRFVPSHIAYIFHSLAVLQRADAGLPSCTLRGVVMQNANRHRAISPFAHVGLERGRGRGLSLARRPRPQFAFAIALCG
jgi:hypothetical protein